MLYSSRPMPYLVLSSCLVEVALSWWGALPVPWQGAAHACLDLLAGDLASSVVARPYGRRDELEVGQLRENKY